MEKETLVKVNNLVVSQIQGRNLEVDCNFAKEYKEFSEGFQPVDFSIEHFRKSFDSDKAINASRQTEKIIRSIRLENFALPKNIEKPVSVYILIGNGKTDGFALISEETFVFFDLFTLFNQKREDLIDPMFVAHELGHGFHFNCNPEFALKNYTTPEDHLLKSMISEGVAAYLSEKAFPENSDKDIFWCSFLSNSQLKKWKEFCVSSRCEFGNRIKTYLNYPSKEEDLRKDLFYVLEMDNLEQKRAGYFYGYQIVKSYFAKHSLKLDFSYSEIRPEILEYFDISA